MVMARWEEVPQPVLHASRSLLCIATNSTPHKRRFTHARRSYNGHSLPIWLPQLSRVLMRNQARVNKYESIVQEVELIKQI